MSDYLPDEVMIQILYKLLAKSLIKCTSVCESWNSLINFISDHLTETLSSKTTNPLLLIRLCLYGKEQYSLHSDNVEFNEKFFSLPEPNIEYNVYGRFVRDFIGFSFNSIGNDYNVLRISPWNSEETRRPWKIRPCPYHNFRGKDLVEAELYSLKANSWKSIMNIAPQYYTNCRDVPATVNGTMHWIAHKRNLLDA
ncbi:uncharacterized protein LOC105633197 [Jatropha curcas]|uniref:uncharacterized protein LOC105633197 n=1 Tax=Jatropha curcas TaxID=180498 RepID=UPI0018935C2C|nr:uncharacterized protein LOC105633197 [Jatropha curcas]